jgi:tetratricopeptide (TPR) repeat protein
MIAKASSPIALLAATIAFSRPELQLGHHRSDVPALKLGPTYESGEIQTPATDDLAARAERARGENRAEEAIRLYRQALAARPGWAEGWFNLGTLLYERDAFADARAAFESATRIDPKGGTAWAMRGLCEFQLGEPDQALADIRKGQALGVSGDPQFRHVLVYHEGRILLGQGEFERAQEAFDRLAADGVESDELAIALGRSVLRARQVGGSTDDPTESQQWLRAGRAEILASQKKFAAAEHAYEQLTTDFPAVRNVHYALGRYFVATAQPDKAVAAYERELAVSPDHVPARLGIAAIKAQTDPAVALKYAEESVKLNPRIPLGHFLLGSLLLHTPDTTRAIAELEIAEASVRDDPSLYYALGRAYARAGRADDAARARATFKRLTEARQQGARRTPDPAEPK